MEEDKIENGQTESSLESKEEVPIKINGKDYSESRKTDYFLEMHVISANRGLTFSITLNVGGILVSGDLVSGKEYFQEFGKKLQDAHPSDPERKLEKSIAKLGDIYNEPTTEPPQFIHLKNARFFNAGIGSGIPKDGALWRGRVESVDGFILGSFITTH